MKTALACPVTFLVALSTAGASATTNAPAFSLTTPAPRPWSLRATWENASYGGTDRFYTDGASWSLSHIGGNWLDSAADWLPWGSGRRSSGYDLGQVMITSDSELLPIPDPNDQPSAVILYAALSLYIDRGHSYDGLKIITGVVGPWPLDEVRHTRVPLGINQTQGWDYQLHSEPFLNLVYEHCRKYHLWGASNGLTAEALPMATALLGNVLTQGQMSGQLRFGYNLPNDYGTTLMRGIDHMPPPPLATDPQTQPKLGVFIYAGLHGNLVLHNIILDGNTWKSSASAGKEFFVPTAEVGLAVATRRFLVAFSYVFSGREFKGQPDNSGFGAFTGTYRF